MTSIPRGWAVAQSGQGSGVTTKIVIPGVAGITHVLTAINASSQAATASPAATANVASVTSNANVLLQCGDILEGAANTPQYSVGGSMSWSGELAGLPGQDLTVQIASPAGWEVWMDIAGYDI